MLTSVNIGQILGLTSTTWTELKLCPSQTLVLLGSCPRFLFQTRCALVLAPLLPALRELHRMGIVSFSIFPHTALQTAIAVGRRRPVDLLAFLEMLLYLLVGSPMSWDMPMICSR